ncbi:MAG: ribulose-phosphate 3-epimerase [Pseudomonadota bacterium]
MTLLISPSILAADAAHLGDEITAIDQAGADMIHVDVMDGHFVPNLTMGAGIVKALRPYSEKPFDVHLMIAPVDPYIEDFAQAGANILTVHPEAGPHLHRTLQTIRAHNMTPGVAVNPATPLSLIEPVLDMVGMVLMMSVNPGFGGQSFIESQLPRITAMREMIDRQAHDIILEVDGGVKPENARRIREAGATALVAGTAVFKGGSKLYAENIRALRKE